MNNKFGPSPVRRVAIGGAVALGATALVIATVPAFADSDQPQPRADCEAEPLLEDEDIESISGAVDASGSWAAGRIYQDDGIDIRLWNDGETTDLDVPGGDAQAFGVNGHGSVVGVTVMEDQWEATAYAHHDGEIVEMALADDGTAEAWPRAINDDGVVAGYSLDENMAKVSAVRWESATDEAEVLPLPDDAETAAAQDIDADGTIVGYYVDSEGVSHPYQWDAEGNGEALDVGDGAAEAHYVHEGWIAGEDVDTETPLLWSPDGEVAEVSDLEKVQGVSGNGDLIGKAEDGSGLLTADGELVSLEPTEGGSGGRVTAINAGGDVIVGADQDADGGNQSIVWRCS